MIEAQDIPNDVLATLAVARATLPSSETGAYVDAAASLAAARKCCDVTAEGVEILGLVALARNAPHDGYQFALPALLSVVFGWDEARVAAALQAACDLGLLQRSGTDRPGEA